MQVIRAWYRQGWHPDVVTAQTPWEDGVLGLVFARSIGARYILQMHFDPFGPGWLNEGRFNGLKLRVTRMLARRADRVRVVSRSMVEGVARDFGVDRERIDCVPVSVTFQPDDRPHGWLATWVADRPAVLFVGRFYRPKNLGLWVEVAQIVAARRPDCVFILAGDGPERAGVEARLAALGLAERTMLTGDCSQAELAGIYPLASVFLLTSSSESWGRVIVEAQLSGLPVVSTACGGPSELIAHGQTGYLAPLDDVEALAGYVIQLLDEPTARRDVGARAQAAAVARHDPAKQAERVAGMFLS
jgi:glycosyltransferase involved in cell wall biosynthesis